MNSFTDKHKASCTQDTFGIDKYVNGLLNIAEDISKMKEGFRNIVKAKCNESGKDRMVKYI